MGSAINGGEGVTAMAANDNVQIALIGAGGMGQGDARYSTSIPGVKLVAACDLYTGRLERCREVWSKDIFTTRDYREVLARKDVDAVIIGTTDHWHARITMDAVAAGKDVYCEKPMVQKIEEGKPVIDAVQRSGRILQIGSQYASSLVFQKAREMVKQGAIGEINMVEAWLDRNTALGAWQYSIPTDASPQTVDWDRFLGNAPKRAFDATRFFRWRNYQDYGTGLAGDLYVHLLTGLHVVTGALGPSRIFSTGGLRYWNDGRDVPDVMLAAMDYPGFTFTLRVNFKSSVQLEDFGFRFIGSEGILNTTMSECRLSKQPREADLDYTLSALPAAFQKQLTEQFQREHPVDVTSTVSMRSNSGMRYVPPPGYSAHRQHHVNFIEAVRTRKPFFEDGVFGFRTAGPALLTGVSLNEGKVCGWDPVKMERVS
jgi:predicted dehydrogenase